MNPYYKRLFIDVLHVQRDQILAAAKIETTLVLIHMKDPVIAGVEGETERSYGASVHKFWEKNTKENKSHNRECRASDF